MTAKSVIKLIASKIAAYIGGPLAWLWSQILYYGGQALYDFISNWIREAKRDKVQESAKETYDKIQADPTKTLEEKAKAYADYQNAGR